MGSDHYYCYRRLVDIQRLKIDIQKIIIYFNMVNF